MDLVASVVEISVEFVLSTRSSSVSLVRMVGEQSDRERDECENKVILWDPDGPLLDDEWAVKLSPETYWG